MQSRSRFRLFDPLVISLRSNKKVWHLLEDENVRPLFQCTLHCLKFENSTVSHLFLSLFSKLIIKFVYVYVCVCAHARTHAHARAHLYVFMIYACATAQLDRVSSLLPPCGFQRWNSNGHLGSRYPYLEPSKWF